YTKKFPGPQGFPVGSENRIATLISGGIDSPVAAYQIMTRGSDILPIYFYNKPIAAEDHLLRFESALSELKKYHPAKKWKYVLVDFEKINNKLLNIGKGRMILQRRAMFKVAEKVVKKKNLAGLATGESIGQKSSQTARNFEITSKKINKPIHRPLLTWNKNEIVRKAKSIGTFENSTIESACRSMSPDKPSTQADEERIRDLENQIEIQDLVQKTYENRKIKEL
ncbi:MAG: tRNA 4-thiouridine(8) synthase ThiI, partial [Candidatus Nanohaloarchaea archaeon]